MKHLTATAVNSNGDRTLLAGVQVHDSVHADAVKFLKGLSAKGAKIELGGDVTEKAESKPKQVEIPKQEDESSDS